MDDLNDYYDDKLQSHDPMCATWAVVTACAMVIILIMAAGKAIL